MSNLVILGAQWGDEGKGKIVDLLSSRFDAVARFQGGANAGHTVVIGDRKTVLHQVPSGILGDIPLCVIGNGAVVDPAGLIEEIDMLTEQGITVDGRFFVSDRAAMVMPYHRLLDTWNEERLAGKKIGTTGRGIGPTYADKYSRTGMRMGDLLNKARMRKKIEDHLKQFNELATEYYGKEPLVASEIIAKLESYADRLSAMIADTRSMLYDSIIDGKKVMFEGAQGTMLDIDHGTYPYVTSSNTTSGGVCTGTGLPPKFIGTAFGILKAYCTRVGEGPFPSEDLGQTGNDLRDAGGEYGATTGRPRRCGWFDAVAARYAVELNGLDGVIVTKIDVLDRLDEIKICTAYKLDGKQIDTVPACIEQLSRCEPVYETFKVWDGETAGKSNYDELPAKAHEYIALIEKLLGVPAVLISTGKERDETVIREELVASFLDK
jgi:adenylosuccinate synthase